MSLIIPANTLASGGYEVDNSLRFNSGSSDHLNRAFGSSSTDTKATWSFWIKRSKISSGAQFIFQSRDANNNNDRTYFRFSSSDGLDFFVTNSSGTGILALQTNRIFRDVLAWYHIVIKLDTTQGTASNRAKFYINGVEETSFSTATYPDQNANIRTVSNAYTGWGQNIPNNSSFFGGYLSEVCFIDGTALDGDSFGEFDEDSGIWKPKNVSGLTFGTNGYYLEFKESGTGTNASGMGADTSGNDNHFAVNNLTAIDQTTDTCTNNFATINPLVRNKSYNDGSLAEGNTYFAPDGRAISVSSIGVTSGKWYAEFKTQDAGALYVGVGLLRGLDALSDGGMSNPIFYDNNPSYAIGYGADGALQYNSTTASYGSGYSDNNIVGIALDMDNKEFYISVNGTFQASGDPTSGASKTNGAAGAASYNPLDDGGEIFFFVSDFSAGGVGQCFHNYGNPAFAISSGNTDGDGYGNFEYAVPSGYFALNTKNLAEYG